jgi:predicted RNase H-like HicB family nuclease
VTDFGRYPAQVFWSEEDEGYIAIATDLPGCSSFGATQQEALAELQDAIAAWIEAAQGAGNPVPAPSDLAKASEYSGRLLVRMPRDLHAHLARLAKYETVSLNQCVVYLLTWASAHRSFELTTKTTFEVTNAGQWTLPEANSYTAAYSGTYAFNDPVAMKVVRTMASGTTAGSWERAVAVFGSVRERETQYG